MCRSPACVHSICVTLLAEIPHQLKFHAVKVIMECNGRPLQTTMTVWLQYLQTLCCAGIENYAYFANSQNHHIQCALEFICFVSGRGPLSMIIFQNVSTLS